MTPWDQRAARILVGPLVRSRITPNQLTVLALIVALVGASLLAVGGEAIHWGAGLFVLSRFLDHFDGELARQKAMTSRLGYYLDYAAGGLSYSTLFAGLGAAFRDGPLGDGAIALGLAAAAAAMACVVLNLGIDKARDDIDTDSGEAVGYPGFAGFELEDGIYLLAPITWLGWLHPFFIAAAVGAVVYGLWTCITLVRLRGG